MNLKTMKNFRRLVEFLKKCPNGIVIYDELKEDLRLLSSPDLKENIKSDLSHILPGLLILASNADDNILKEVTSVYNSINDIVSKNIGFKTESWWKEMESTLVPNKFFTGLTSLIEKDKEFWDKTWIFAVSLTINDTQVQGSTVNSLLKVMEVAFKKSLRDETGSVMDKAFNCWMKFIEIFTSNPLINSKKIISLLIRPLTIPMGPRSHLRIIQTFKCLFERVGKSGDKNIVSDIINPFLEHSYRKNEHSFSKSHPNECCEILIELLNGNELIRKLFVLPVLSIYKVCVENKTSEALLLTLWNKILDCSNIIDINNYEEYFEKVMSVRQSILNNNEVMKDNLKLGDFLINNGLPPITPELLDKLLISGVLSPKKLADLMECNEFRTKTFANYFNQFINNVSIETEKRETSTGGHMEKWDTFCAAFNLFIDSKGYQFQDNDSHTFKSLILFPLQTCAKWAGVTQRTWHSIIDTLDKKQILKPLIPDIILILDLNLDGDKVKTSTVIDIISHLVNLDKTAPITSTIDKILLKLPKEDPKNAIDLLAFIEVLIGYGDKKQYLSGVLSELLRICTNYDQLYEHRIKTKLSKLHRKLILDSKTEQKDKSSKESKTPSPKIRSPLLIGRSFLHRLAKSEEKKALSLVSPPLLGDGNAKNSLKLKEKNKIVETNDDKDKVTILKDKTMEENISKEATLPKTVNIVVNDHPNKVGNNLITIKSPEENINVKGKLQNGDTNNFSSPSLKPVGKKSAISYFEDDSQEFVIVPPKPKSNTPLTDHQKEVLQKKSIIPAMYQDLTQDTQSNSNLVATEIIITPASDSPKKVDGPEEKNNKHDISKESLDLIEVTPPSEELATTPLKTRTSFSANKKLNFEGLVKANSPVGPDKQDNKIDLISPKNVTPTSRRQCYRKTTSKYGANRIITPTKDLDDSLNSIKEMSSTSEEKKQKKTFVKRGDPCKKPLEVKSVQEIEPKEESKSISKEHEKEVLNSVDIDTKETHSNENKAVEINDANIIISDTADEISASKVESQTETNFGSAEKKNSESTFTDNLISEIENFISDTELIGGKDVSCKMQESVSESAKAAVDSKPVEEVTKVVPEKAVNNDDMIFGKIIAIEKVVNEDEKNNLLNKTDNIVSEIRSDNITPPSSQKVRRPRKKPPTPFSPKLTRSKKLSLQSKLISPKSPKDVKTKIRAPKPNTECFSSDSNDSVSGIAPLAKDETKTVVAEVKVANKTPKVSKEESVKNNLKKSEIVSTKKASESIENVKDNGGNEKVDEKLRVSEGNKKLPEKSEFSEGNEKVVKKAKLSSNVNEELTEKSKLSDTNAKVAATSKLPDGNEKGLEKSKSSDGNEANEALRKTRKRKSQSVPEENSEKSNTQEVKINTAKRGRKKGSFSGLDHWLFKKDKHTVNSTLSNKDLENKSTEDIVNEAPLMDKRENTQDIPLSTEEAHLERNRLESSSKESVSEAMDCTDEESKITEIVEEEFNDLVDREIVICDEPVECSSSKTDHDADEIIESSQKTQLPKGIIDTLNKQENSTVQEKVIASSSENDVLVTAEVNEHSPSVTKLEKITNGMKTCDLIFKGGEIEEKIIIYMAQAPTSPKASEMNEDCTTESSAAANDEPEADIDDQKTELCTALAESFEKDDISTSKAECSDITPVLSAMEQSDLIQAVSNDNDAVDVSDKCIEKINTDEHPLIDLVDNDVAIISNEAQDPVEISEPEEKSTSSTFLDEMKNEVLCIDSKESNLLSENNMDVVDIEVNIPEENTNEVITEAASEQNNSEQLFKNDTPKKRGARFIHTTEHEEDGGDTAEDRRRRNYRSRRITVEDINALSGSSGRSKQMIQLAQQGRKSRISTPRRRPNIIPITYGANWPTGPTEEWIAARPTTPGLCVSPGILKSPLTVSSISTVSPPKKKRVNFLDPPVSLGLLYEKDSKIGVGQLHYAELSPGKQYDSFIEEGLEEKLKVINNDEQMVVESPAQVKVLPSGEDMEILGSDEEIPEPVTDKTNSSTDDDKVCPEHPPISVINAEDSLRLPNPTVEDEENLDITPVEELDVNEAQESINNIPTVEQLQTFLNNKEFIDNLALAVINSGTRDFWYLQFFNSVNENLQK